MCIKLVLTSVKMGQKSSAPIKEPEPMAMAKAVTIDSNYNPFDPIPIEVLIHILKNLPLSSIKDARNTCSKWRNAFNEPKFNLLMYIVILDANSNSRWVFGKCEKIGKNSLTFWATQWPPDEADAKGIPFSTVRMGVISPGNSVGHLMKFFREGCEFLEFLRIDCLSLSSLSVTGLAHVLPKVKWSNLTQLDIAAAEIPNLNELESEFVNHCKAVASFLELIQIPQLKMLKLKYGSSHVTAAEQTNIMISSLNVFLRRHSPTLKHLDLEFAIDSGSGSKNARKMPISSNPGQNIGSKLEHLALRGSFYNIIDQLSPYLWQSDKLKTLHWTPDPTLGAIPVWGSCSTIRALINNSQDSLVKATIGFANENNASQFDLSWLRNCAALKHLELESIQNIGNLKIHLPKVTTLDLHLDSQIILQNEDHWIIKGFPNVEIVKLKYKYKVDLDHDHDWFMPLLTNWQHIRGIYQVSDWGKKFYNLKEKSDSECLSARQGIVLNGKTFIVE